MSNIRIAILGAGGMGNIHAATLTGIPGVKLISVCDHDEAKAESLAGKYSCASYSDFMKMLDEQNPGALVICIPPFAHEGQFEEACRRGIPVFIEKPIALNADRGRKMVTAARKSGVLTQTGFHMRYGSAVQKIKSLISSGESGRSVLFTGRYLCRSLHSSWWMDVTKSGGQILEQAIHLYDLCRYLIASEPVSIQAQMNNLCHKAVPGYSVEDVSAATITFEDGTIAVITATNCAVPGRWDAPLEMAFADMFVSLHDPDNAEIHYISDSKPAFESYHQPRDNRVDELADFINCLRENKNPACDISEGFKSLCLVAAAVKSAENSGETVNISDILEE